MGSTPIECVNCLAKGTVDDTTGEMTIGHGDGCPQTELDTLRTWQRGAVPLLKNLLHMEGCAGGDDHCPDHMNTIRALLAQADDNPSSIDPPGVMDEGVGDG